MILELILIGLTIVLFFW